jgi:DNA-binding protein YbaB
MLNPLEVLIQRQVARWQQGIEQAAEELRAAVVEAVVEDGAVKARVNGLGEVLEIAISPALAAAGDAEKLSELVTAAVREALSRARELKCDKIAQHTPLGALGIELPDII